MLCKEPRGIPLRAVSVVRSLRERCPTGGEATRCVRSALSRVSHRSRSERTTPKTFKRRSVVLHFARMSLRPDRGGQTREVTPWPSAPLQQERTLEDPAGRADKWRLAVLSASRRPVRRTFIGRSLLRRYRRAGILGAAHLWR